MHIFTKPKKTIHMNANKFIIASTIVYLIILVIMAVSYSNMKFTGSDAAGNGMAKGLTFFYGLGLLFLIAIVITIINAFVFKNITLVWVKFLCALPLALPLLIFGYTVLEIGRPREDSLEKQAHRISFEFRTVNRLENPRFSFRSSGGGLGSKIGNEEKEGNFYVYKSSTVIYYEINRRFSISCDAFKSDKLDLDLPYKPLITPFTPWKTLPILEHHSQDTAKIEFRYQVSKK